MGDKTAMGSDHGKGFRQQAIRIITGLETRPGAIFVPVFPFQGSASSDILLIAGKILLLSLVVMGALQSGTPASYIDTYGSFFVLAGGAALMMISFPGAEIWRAFRHAAGGSGSDAEVRNSAHFWEAAGRGFWIMVPGPQSYPLNAWAEVLSIRDLNRRMREIE